MVKDMSLSNRINKIKGVAFLVCLTMFVGGICIGLLGRLLCIKNNRDYQSLQPELFAPDPIETVLHDPELKQIYVCYNDASYVNVYSESGKFLWAVSTPYLRNVYCEIIDNSLFIYNFSEAYIYDARSGAFIEYRSAETLDLSYDFENESSDEFEDGEFYFDTYQVYRSDVDGNLRTVVERPWWYWIFNGEVVFLVSALGAAGMSLLVFNSSSQEYKKIKKEKNTQKSETVLKTRKARFILRYFKITVAIHLLYVVLNIIFGIFFEGILSIGILPLALHFIIMQVVFSNMVAVMKITSDENSVLGHWQLCGWGSFIAAFLSVIIVAAIAG